MTRHFPLLLLLLLLVGVPSPSRAQVRALILYDKPVQTVEFTYDYTNSSLDSPSLNSSSERHRMSPRYTFDIDHALFDPRIYLGHFGLSLKYDENLVSGSSTPSYSYSNLDLGYNLNGILYKDRPYSANYFARREHQWINQDFGAGYDSTIETLGGGIKFVNRIAPTILNYVWNRSVNQYQSNQWTQTYDTLSLNSRHTYRNLSETALDVSYNQSNNTTNQPGNYGYFSNILQANLDNKLTWDLGPRLKQLNSTIRYQDTVGSSNYQTFNLREDFLAWWGKALSTGLLYSLQKQADSGNYSATTNIAQAWVSHRLFTSLTTRLNVQYLTTSYSVGSEETYSGGGYISYQKSLPRDSSLQVQTSLQYSVTDRNLTQGELLAQDTLKLTTNYLSNIFSQQNVLQGTVEVTTSKSGAVVKCLMGQDYRLYGTSGFGPTYIEVIPGGPNLAVGDTVTVRYQYKVDPSTKFSNLNFWTNSDLYLLGNKMRLYVYYQNSQQNLLAGVVNNPAMYGNTSTLRVGGEYRQDRHTFGLSYLNSDYTGSHQQSIMETYQFYTPVPRGAFSLGVTNNTIQTDTTFGVTSLLSGSSTNNILTSWLSYNASLFRTGSFLANLNYAMSRGGGSNRDNLNLYLNYQMSMGKFSLILSTQFVLLDYGATTQLNNVVRLTLRRYF
jgi:hypothetical protein